MKRVSSPERPDLDRICADLGFAFAYADDEPYWDETVRYEFALEEVECDLEAPTAELYAMCLELASQAVRDGQMLRRLGVPETAWDAVAASWRASEPSLYGRFDLCYGGAGPAKLLEFNGDIRPRSTRPPCSSGTGSRPAGAAAGCRGMPTSSPPSTRR